MAQKIYLGGLTNTVMHIESDGTTHIEEMLPDVSTILDANQAERDHRFSGASPGGFFHAVGRVDVVTALQWAREAGLGDDIWGSEMSIILEKKFQESENAKLRTAPTVRDPHIIIRGAR